MDANQITRNKFKVLNMMSTVRVLDVFENKQKMGFPDMTTCAFKGELSFSSAVPVSVENKLQCISYVFSVQ